jgi:tRNA(His) guanylyltransferase
MGDLGDRMKSYENVYRHYLTPRMPVIIRLDGKAFHTLTKRLEKPFDDRMDECMELTAYALLEEVQNARCAYIQSDEISLLLIDYNKYTSQQWFKGNVQKIVSVSAACASSEFTYHFNRILDYDTRVMFDSRAFVLPEREVVNYFIWRQKDAERNVIQAVGQANYSSKVLHKKSCKDILTMLAEDGIDFNRHFGSYSCGKLIYKLSDLTYGVKCVKFSDNRNIIEDFMQIEEQ